MPIKTSVQNDLTITPSHTSLDQASHMATPTVNAEGMCPMPLYCKMTWRRGTQVSDELGAIILSIACVHVEYLKVILFNMRKNVFLQKKNLLQEP